MRDAQTIIEQVACEIRKAVKEKQALDATNALEGLGIVQKNLTQASKDVAEWTGQEPVIRRIVTWEEKPKPRRKRGNKPPPPPPARKTFDEAERHDVAMKTIRSEYGRCSLPDGAILGLDRKECQCCGARQVEDMFVWHGWRLCGDCRYEAKTGRIPKHSRGGPDYRHHTTAEERREFRGSETLNRFSNYNAASEHEAAIINDALDSCASSLDR